MDNSVIDPVTGETYSLEHLKPCVVTFSVIVDGESLDVPLRIHFSNHCFTRSRKDEDEDEAVIFTERKRGGYIDERVFNEARWRFSQSLPDIIKDLHSRGCFSGDTKEIIYRQEKQPHTGSYEGWYICFRLSASNYHKNLTLSVRSIHWRYNRPFNIRGTSKRFFALLSRYYAEQKEKRDWL